MFLCVFKNEKKKVRKEKGWIYTSIEFEWIWVCLWVGKGKMEGREKIKEQVGEALVGHRYIHEHDDETCFLVVVIK